ncbi:MAG: hypothetical protein A3I66_03485 [Burkholderiales bacterium RIFCSPLOWO2_02_FULL_57_36]|nr:MAG: hypothetical protein A3I66_03485 [Burkholderiales bacterium RIFCSPLOWO2_02_FULL_57_36]
MDIYIYYTVRTDLADSLSSRVLEMQAALAAKCSVAGALKCRRGEKDGRHTWMEIYLAVPEGFDAILEDAVAHAKLATLIDGERHTEYFMDASLCA